jgi:hypothetical protein
MLHAFRHNASPIREGLERLSKTDGSLRVDAPEHLHHDARFLCYQRLSGPVRRTLRPTDRVSFLRIMEETRVTAGAPHTLLADITAAWQALQEELDATVSLGGGPVERRRILHDWLDAVTFSNQREFKDSYGAFLARWDKAGEALAAQLAEQTAAIVLRLDAVLAEMLEEPLVLPPPPPFIDPADQPSWWRRLFGVSGNRRAG